MNTERIWVTQKEWWLAAGRGLEKSAPRSGVAVGGGARSGKERAVTRSQKMTQRVWRMPKSEVCHRVRSGRSEWWLVAGRGLERERPVTGTFSRDVFRQSKKLGPKQTYLQHPSLAEYANDNHQTVKVLIVTIGYEVENDCESLAGLHHQSPRVSGAHDGLPFDRLIPIFAMLPLRIS